MPSTPKAEKAATTTEPGAVDFEAPEELGFSKQAHFSTYSKDDDDTIDEGKNPPDGPHVKQELGKPSEGKAKAFGES